jgi:hypothetical protein
MSVRPHVANRVESARDTVEAACRSLNDAVWLSAELAAMVWRTMHRAATAPDDRLGTRPGTKPPGGRRCAAVGGGGAAGFAAGGR